MNILASHKCGTLVMYISYVPLLAGFQESVQWNGGMEHWNGILELVD